MCHRENGLLHAFLKCAVLLCSGLNLASTDLGWFRCRSAVHPWSIRSRSERGVDLWLIKLSWLKLAVDLGWPTGLVYGRAAMDMGVIWRVKRLVLQPA